MKYPGIIFFLAVTSCIHPDDQRECHYILDDSHIGRAIRDTKEFMEQDFAKMPESDIRAWKEKVGGPHQEHGVDTTRSLALYVTTLEKCHTSKKEVGLNYKAQLAALDSAYDTFEKRRIDSVKAQNQAGLAEYEKKCEAMRVHVETKMKKKFLCDMGFNELINKLKNGEIKEKDAKGYIVSYAVHKQSARFKAIQATSQVAIFSPTSSWDVDRNTTILVRKGGIIQGQLLDQVANDWEFIGVTYYQSLLGERQAFEFRMLSPE